LPLQVFPRTSPVLTSNIVLFLMALTLDFSRLKEVTPEKFYPLYTDKHRHLHLIGGAGSGKSRFAGQKFIVRIMHGMATGKVHRIVALRKTTPAARKSVYAVFDHYRIAWGLERIMHPVRSELSFHFVNGSQIICGGLDDPSKLKSIEGVTGFWLEEPTELTLDDLRQIRLRLRGDFKYLQAVYTYNPSDLGCALYQSIYQHLPPRYTGEIEGGRGYVMHSTYHDNPFIDKEYIEELEGLKNQDEGYYKIYCLGEWGARKALIYHGRYEVIEEPDWSMQFDDECYGLDFGYNNPTALLHVGFLDNVPCVEEIIYSPKLTNTQLIERMREEEVSPDIVIYADSAEPARIQEICDAGFDCRPAENAKKPNAVKARIDYIQSRGFRVRETSVETIGELTGYRWKEDPRTGIVLDEPVKFRDHAMNAMEYAIFEHCSQRMIPGIAFT